MSSVYYLFIIRSPGFGLVFINYNAFATLSLAYKYYSPTHYTKGTITQNALFDDCIKIQFSQYSNNI